MGYNTLRCSICNKTNNPDVISCPEEYLKGKSRFKTDPKNEYGFICYECDDTVRNMYNEYEIEDDL